MRYIKVEPELMSHGEIIARGKLTSAMDAVNRDKVLYRYRQYISRGYE